MTFRLPIRQPLSKTWSFAFTDSRPFGLYDIFNYLIYYSTEYDKHVPQAHIVSAYSKGKYIYYMPRGGGDEDVKGGGALKWH